MQDKLLSTYRRLAAEGGFSWENLAQGLGITPDELRAQHPHREGLDQAAWRDMLALSIARAQAEPVYAEYTARERMLSFYFTLMEQLKQDRGYALPHLRDLGVLDVSPGFLADFWPLYEGFVTQVLREGMDAGEIPRRIWISDQYAKVHYLQTLFVLRAWAADTTPDGTETDSAIEKAVNLGFDVMERNFLDSAWDFGKYLWSRN